MPRDDPMKKTTIYLPEKMRQAAYKAAARIQGATGREVTIAQITRWGLFLAIKRIAEGEHGPPEDYPYREVR